MSAACTGMGERAGANPIDLQGGSWFAAVCEVDVIPSVRKGRAVDQVSGLQALAAAIAFGFGFGNLSFGNGHRLVLWLVARRACLEKSWLSGAFKRPQRVCTYIGNLLCAG